jgi:hypothetical protein
MTRYSSKGYSAKGASIGLTHKTSVVFDGSKVYRHVGAWDHSRSRRINALSSCALSARGQQSISCVCEICLSTDDSARYQTFAVLYGRPDLTQFSRLLGSEDDRKRHEEDMLAFLANLPEHELFALQEVNLFLQHILRWLITATHDSTGELHTCRTIG